MWGIARRGCASARPRHARLAWPVRTEHTAASARPVARWATAPRTHHCGELGASCQDQRVSLAGWVRTPRTISKNLSFVPLQDASGTVQLVVSDPALVAALEALPVESVIAVQGQVQLRARGAANPAMRTGDIEVHVHSWELLNAADDTLPFYATQCHDAQALPKDTLRAKFRYLDLRRPALGDKIRLRSRVAHAARCFLHDRGFCEVETPVLLRSTPEGAREFLVPTRQGGTEPQFYALQQSPQQPKQLLMVSGVTDRYFQFAKCFRDEDGRKDRQPEFTQIDIEMSFVSGSGDTAAWTIGGTQVRDVTEGLVRAMWAHTEQPPLPSTFPVLSYEHVMNTYGSDKPDLRFGLEICPLAPTCATHAVDMLVVPHYASCKLSTRQVEQLRIDAHGERMDVEHYKARRSAPEALARLLLAKSRHMAVAQVEDADALTETVAAAMERANAFRGSAPMPPEDRCDVFIASRPRPTDGGSTLLGDVRLRIADLLPLRSREPQVLWVTEFPLFTRADADKAAAAHGRWSSTHHPFTAPTASDVPRLMAARECASPAERDELLAAIHGQHYDLVLNGAEIGGGSVRVHDPAMQLAILQDVLALTDEEVARFGHLLQALRCGAPPHAGIALGT
ncbi:aspartate--tRNA ligase [Malassezia caprae]|uniref:Aspartate--tRNA ligase n=1 Tax=Malassezia caprae TaxID=1381934 RepID=A0AAF0E8D1_9BASI|nr:aspartate--tRNA ligase [Malassezia caprae]